MLLFMPDSLFCVFFFSFFFLFFFNDTATTEIYTLSLHDALPISVILRNCPRPLPRLPKDEMALLFLQSSSMSLPLPLSATNRRPARSTAIAVKPRSEEHTSELQSHWYISYAVFCLKKKKKQTKKTKKTKHKTQRKVLFKRHLPILCPPSI